MAEDQLWRTNAGGDQFLEPQRRRRKSPWELSHEGDAGLLDALAKLLRLQRIIDIQRRAAIDAFSKVTRRQHRQGPIPLGRQNQHSINIIARAERSEAIDL